MKKWLILLMFVLSVFSISERVNAQCHLNCTYAELCNYTGFDELAIYTTTDNIKYCAIQYTYGTYYYYFDNNTYKTALVRQVCFSEADSKVQGRLYSEKYVNTAKNRWTAIVEGGKFYIKLTYQKDIGKYVFVYYN